MLTGAEDFCEKCKKTLCNSVMSLFREKIATNDRPMVVLLNFVFTGLSWYILHFAFGHCSAHFYYVKFIQFNARQLLLVGTFSCVPL